jgi:hypothetical protein
MLLLVYVLKKFYFEPNEWKLSVDSEIFWFDCIWAQRQCIENTVIDWNLHTEILFLLQPDVSDEQNSVNLEPTKCMHETTYWDYVRAYSRSIKKNW